MGSTSAIAFQMVDDILDITGRAGRSGEVTGMDIMESKPNLPLMIAMQGHYPCSAPGP